MIFISLVMLVITCVYLHHKLHYGKWRRRQIQCPTALPLVGNMGEVITQRKSFIEVMQEAYRKYQDVPYFGFYRFLTPVIVIRDTQLAKRVLVQDFDHFMDTDLHANEDEILLQKNVFMRKGEDWKKSREQIAPLLSSGKIRLVYPLLQETCGNLIKHIREAKGATTEGLETREFCNKYTTDVVASCAFGLNANCLNDPDSMFREMGRNIFEPTTLTGLRITLVTMVPILSNFIKMQLVPPVVSDWIMKVVSDTVQYRRDNNIQRDDFLQSLMQLYDKTQGKDFDMTDIAAQCTSFLLDGFETSSSVLSLTLYEVACHSDVQERILQESNEVLSRHEGKITYDAMIEMNYADAVINETMRKWPIIAGIPRRCTKRYELPGYPNGPEKGIIIEPGDSILVPTGCFCKDPQYFSDPETFKPSRFLEERDRLSKDAFYPWGAGLRLCIGQRFATLQTRISLVSIVRAFKMAPTKKMATAPKLDPKSWMPRIAGGIWITYTPRT